MVIANTLAALLAAGSATPVTVEIVTTGHIETPAENYRISANVLACGVTQAAADADLAAKKAAIERSMAAMKVGKVVAAEKLNLMSMMGGIMGARTASECNKPDIDKVFDLSGDDEKGGDKKDAATPEAKVAASATLNFDAPDIATASRAIAALKAADAKPSDKATPVLVDEVAARRAAKQQALTKAVAEAQAYATPLGLGAPVLVKVSERQDIGSYDFITQMIRTIGLPGTTLPDKVATDVTLTVEFRLDPR